VAAFADVNPPLFIKDRGNTVVTFGKFGFGKNKIQFRKNSIILTDSVCVFCHTVA
jgi:hypothetical protein